MEREPTQAYVYQPDPDDGTVNPVIFAVGGPGTEPQRECRFTKRAAQAVADSINSGKLTAETVRAFTEHLKANPPVRPHGRL